MLQLFFDYTLIFLNTVVVSQLTVLEINKKMYNQNYLYLFGYLLFP